MWQKSAATETTDVGDGLALCRDAVASGNWRLATTYWLWSVQTESADPRVLAECWALCDGLSIVANTAGPDQEDALPLLDVLLEQAEGVLLRQPLASIPAVRDEIVRRREMLGQLALEGDDSALGAEMDLASTGWAAWEARARELLAQEPSGLEEFPAFQAVYLGLAQEYQDDPALTSTGIAAYNDLRHHYLRSALAWIRAANELRARSESPAARKELVQLRIWPESTHGCSKGSLPARSGRPGTPPLRRPSTCPRARKSRSDCGST